MNWIHKDTVGRSFLFFAISLSVVVSQVDIFESPIFDSFKQRMQVAFGVQTENASVVKTSEDYWRDSGVNEANLLDFLNDKKCVESEKYFLACANSINLMALQLGLKVKDPLKPDLAFQKLNSGGNPQSQLISEKSLLVPWISLTKISKPRPHDTERIELDESSEISKLETDKNSSVVYYPEPFEAFWTALKKEIPKKKFHLLLGHGINAFYSILNDPHSYIVPVGYYQNVLAKVEAKSALSGIYLKQDFYIKKVLEGSPAARAQIKKGDRLVEIDGRSVAQLSVPEVYDLLKGKLNTSSSIKIYRNNNLLSMKIERKEFTLPAILGKYVKDEKPYGIITLNKFAKGICDKMKVMLVEFNAKDVSGIVLDLRDNPGGQIDEAACIAGLFIGQKKIFELQFLDSKSNPNEEYFGRENKPVFQGPLAILINGGTASASEILAGAMQDYNRGILIGQQTYGKGSFQDGSFWYKNKNLLLFETKGVYFLPSGKSPQLEGLTPDVESDLTQFGKNLEEGREKDNYYNPIRVTGGTTLAAVGSSENRKCLVHLGHLGQISHELGQAGGHLGQVSRHLEKIDVWARKELDSRLDSNGIASVDSEIELAKRSFSCMNTKPIEIVSK